MIEPQEDPIKEVVDRTRRIETRLTRYLEAQGFETFAKRPIWREGEIHIPNLNCSIRDCLAVIPPGWFEAGNEIEIFHKAKLVIGLYQPEETDPQ